MARPLVHVTFLHHDFQRKDPRIDEWVVECTACKYIAKGFTRKPDARAEGIKHEKEANHS